MKLSKVAHGFASTLGNIAKNADDNLIPQLRTAYYMCRQGLAIDTLSSLIELQKANGAPAAYKHHEQVEEMISACSQTLKEKLKTELANAHFIGVMTDESCDIAIYKKLIIYVKIVVNGKSITMILLNSGRTAKHAA